MDLSLLKGLFPDAFLAWTGRGMSNGVSVGTGAGAGAGSGTGTGVTAGAGAVVGCVASSAGLA